jgi:4-hydroxybenzoate polyprenyltransferase
MYYPLIQSSLIPTTKYVSLVNKVKPTMILQDLSIGIPINIFSNIYTNLHYGFDITSTEGILLQFLLGFYTYGNDRLKDAKEYENNKLTIYSDNKIKLYERILKNQNLYYFSLASSVVSIFYLLSDSPINYPFLGLLFFSTYYKEYKPILGEFKPLFIATMWTITSVILPCVLFDNNYSILLEPSDYLPCLLFIFSATNFADIFDLKEDKILGVNTIPVKYGKYNTILLSFVTVAIASILLIENPNFENRFWINSLIEAQHIGLMFALYNSYTDLD